MLAPTEKDFAAGTQLMEKKDDENNKFDGKCDPKIPDKCSVEVHGALSPCELTLSLTLRLESSGLRVPRVAVKG